MPSGKRQQVRCAWCGAAGRWPDQCPPQGVPNDDEEYLACMEEIAWRHGVSDHRRCSVETCEWSAYWQPRLVEAAIRACRDAGQPFVAISTIDSEEPVVLRTFDRLQNAKPFRTRYGERHGLSRVELHGLVPVLRDDGVFV